MSVIDFLRDIGKHFPVNRMLARDTVKRRLESGISYTEFSYVLLQSMDFLNLHREHGVTLQFGGSDQWGNITGGAELIRRADGRHGPRVRDPAGHQGRRHEVRQDRGRRALARPEMMSPYAFHQFWLNVEDEKVGELLRIFTFLSRAEIEALEAAARREAVPARGPEDARRRRHDLRPRRGGDRAGQGGRRGAVRRRRPGGALPAATLARGARARPARPRSTAATGLPSVVDLLVASGLVKSKGEARRTIGEGGAYLNNAARRGPRRGARPRTTSSAARGWCCAAARRTSPASRSSEVTDDARVAGAGLEERARESLPDRVFEYVASGARDGVTAHESRAALARRRLPPARAARRAPTSTRRSTLLGSPHGRSRSGSRRPRCSARSTPTASSAMARARRRRGRR